MSDIDERADERLFALPSDEREAIDKTDLILSIFYQMKRPCPLLDADQRCGVYPVRPVCCRAYMSFSPPWKCDPAYINSDDIPTYLMDFEEEAARILDTLHERHARFGDDTGLRSLLARCLDDQLTARRREDGQERTP